ncbi:ethylene-responsive transcription factor ERF027 [Punica granatum]|uniref:AP2/ERF domain-containing protein n=2 Tax=Punica granatum TaxID=22663 RepID=A0A218X3F7_PUNGR|nr:ethylene-responsive transcription factor ERF027 [Punica granatum]OWM79507.1 hypothetical protein CDL15_Pgr022919 [Punica granatum]PKI35784.1 hypothetical protein CRG98_043819 [Punica granatum]
MDHHHHQPPPPSPDPPSLLPPPSLATPTTRPDPVSPRLVPSPDGSSGKHHPNYRGVRSRSGKWVSEIREPRKTTRIWLGTYPTPDMAAVAYDVAALALKGPEATVNFPELVHAYPVPASTSAADIRAAAGRAAAAREPKPELKQNQPVQSQPEGDAGASSGSTMTATSSAAAEQEFIDEEAILDMPNLLVDMAKGMLVSPPRMKSASPDDSPEDSDGGGLWSYP